MQNPFSYYRSLGLSVIPLRAKDKNKVPLHPWGKYRREFMSDFELKIYDNSAHNIGIVTGILSKIIVVDIDGEEGERTAKELDLPKTAEAITGNGRHLYYRYPDTLPYDSLRGFVRKTRSGKEYPGIDLRAEGNCVTAPPSEHYTGRIYKWVTDLTNRSQFAPCPSWIIEAQTPKPAPIYKETIGEGDISDKYLAEALRGEIQEVLQCLEGSRNTQLNKSVFVLAQLIEHGLLETDIVLEMGQAALAIGLTATEARNTIRYALKSGKENPRKIERREIQPEDHLPPPAILNAEPEEGIAEDLGAQEPEQTNSPVKFTLPYSLILEAPGLIGRTIRWINSCAPYPQPMLELAASIALVGSVMGHKVCTESDLRSNILSLGVAPSGAGKDHARRCIKSLLKACAAEKLLCGEPKSGTAVVNAVHSKDGVTLMLIDEIGRYLKKISSDHSGSHTRDISTKIMEIYSSANTLMIGGEYADNEAQGGRKDLEQPCLCIYGTTVPSHLFSALTSEEAIDGFLARWLIFETKDYHIEGTNNQPSIIPPSDLIDEYKTWLAKPSCTDKSDEFGLSVTPEIIDFSDKARLLLNGYNRSTRLRAKREIDDKTGLESVWNRTAEHAIKLSLLAHEDGYIISGTDARWAIQIANYCAHYMIEAIKGNVRENQQESATKRILKIIANEKNGISMSKIAAKTQWLDRRKRYDILETLLESKQIRKVQTTSLNAKKPSYIFFLA